MIKLGLWLVDIDRFTVEIIEHTALALARCDPHLDQHAVVAPHVQPLFRERHAFDFAIG